jgi:hypothetical protein
MRVEIKTDKGMTLTAKKSTETATQRGHSSMRKKTRTLPRGS